MNRDELLRTVETVQELLIDRVTKNPDADESAYKELRQTLIADARVKNTIPEFLKECRTLAQFWNYINGEARNWAGRRQVIWDAFRPTIDAIETLSDNRRVDAGGFDLKDAEPFVNTLARLLAADGDAGAVAALTYGRPSIEWVEHDRAYGDIYTLYLRVSPQLYAQFGDGRQKLEAAIAAKFYPLLAPYSDFTIRDAIIIPEVSLDPKWREKAEAWLAGKNVNNQGRVRSNNVAPLSCDGLLFRSRPEIHLYQALKSRGVSFAPLPVFVRGGEEYRRLEPDFVVLKDGALMIVEVDGDTVHEETPAEAHARTTMLLHEGAFVERVKASDCDTPEKARTCAETLVRILTKRKASK